jgi:hypothetical protein
MPDSLLQQQLDEVRALLQRTQELFGLNPIKPPELIPLNPDTARHS